MATIKPLSAPAKRLAATITGSASSFQVNDIEGWNGSNLSASDFGTVAYAAFRNSAGTLLELMEIDPSTIANSSITINRRGLKFNGDDLTTEVSGNKLTWVKGDTIVEFGSHFPQLLAHYVDIISDQTIGGVKTFSSIPTTTAGNPTTSTQLATKAYVDLIGTGSASMDRVIVAGNAGETVAAGQLVYLKISDGEWYLCDADTASTVENIILGIAQGAGTDGNAISSGILVYGLDENQVGLTNNTKYYASNTAGGISSSAGTTEVTVGYSRSTTSLFFAPRYDQQITENQQDLIQAIEGGTDYYAASSAATDSYAITIAPAIAAYVTGMRFRFKADVANTGACTLAVSGLSAITIKKQHNQDLSDNDIEAGQIVEVVYDGTNMQMVSQLSTSPSADVQKFTGNGTWTKPGGAKIVDVHIFGGGGGGGSGARNSGSPGNADGSGGGAGGGYSFKRFLASSLGATEAVVVGAGGAGGASKSSDADGDAGSAGGASSFGTTVYLKAPGGPGGAGGVSLGGAGGTGARGNGDISQTGGNGGSGQNNDSGAAGTSTANDISPRGGGGGCAASTGTVGGAGGGFTTNFVQAGGAGGGSGVAGSDGTDIDDDLIIGGPGGGGGGPGVTAGAGGAGGFPGGGGGGGGSGTTTSGAGGTGADGHVVVITYF